MLREAERVRYFADLFPTDLVCTLLGRERCAACEGPPLPGAKTSDDQHWSLAPPDYASPYALSHFLQRAVSMYSLHANSALTGVVTGHSGECRAVFEGYEFVVDVDLKDYGEEDRELRRFLCACGTKKTICDTCWLLAELGAAVCESLVTHACGLGPMLCVASGGKGFHLWWGSPRARSLSPARRASLVALLLEPGDTPAHDAAVTALMKVWLTRGVVRRALLADTESPLARHLLAQLRPEEAAAFTWPVATETPAALSNRRWRALAGVLGPARTRAVVAALGWPKLDRSVVEDRGHLLKLPFSIHHRTTRIALPLPSLQQCLPSQQPTARAVLECEPEARARWQVGVATFRAWLVACQYV